MRIIQGNYLIVSVGRRATPYELLAPTMPRPYSALHREFPFLPSLMYALRHDSARRIMAGHPCGHDTREE
jgi:hypothetical protein